MRVVLFVRLFFYSTAFSFALMLGIHGGKSGMPFEYVLFGAFMAALLIMAYGMWLGEFAKTDLVQYVLLGMAVVGLAPLALGEQLPPSMLYAGCTLLMLCFTGYDFFSLHGLLLSADSRGGSFSRSFALGRLGNASGMFVGWALAAVVLALDKAIGGSPMIQMLPLALVVGLVAIIMACSYGDSGISQSKDFGRLSDDAVGSWKLSCESICDAYGLSPREREVFALCAKGRDTPFICGKLYISAHTVKSHIYHIYGKMGIHSQQELISMVEERADEIRRAD